MESAKTIPKFIWKNKHPIARKTWGGKKSYHGRLALSDVKTHYKAL